MGGLIGGLIGVSPSPWLPSAERRTQRCLEYCVQTCHGIFTHALSCERCTHCAAAAKDIVGTGSCENDHVNVLWRNSRHLHGSPRGLCCMLAEALILPQNMPSAGPRPTNPIIPPSGQQPHHTRRCIPKHCMHVRACTSIPKHCMHVLLFPPLLVMPALSGYPVKLRIAPNQDLAFQSIACQ